MTRALWALLLVAAASAPVEARVTVCSKKFTESVIVGELATQLLQRAGIDAGHRAQLGGTRIVWDALVAGACDVYPEYTGTLSEEIFAGRPVELAAAGVHSSGSLGFEDRYALGMLETRAEALGLRQISDLKAQPALRFGLSEEFASRSDGWPRLAPAYELPQQPRRLDHDLAYRALAAGALDVMDVYSTDAEIPRYHIRVLADDRHFFRDYQAVLLWRADLPPAAAVALARLEGRIDARQMAELNARAKLDRVPETDVAAQFLARLGLGGTARSESPLAAFGRRTREHLFLVTLSLLLAVLISIPLGIWAARHPRLGQVILAVSGVVQTVPSLALLVFMIPLFGIGTAPALAALFLYSVLPIVRNTYTGLRDIAPSLRESAAALGLPAGARLRYIELPLASRAILAGIKTSAVINVGTATLGAIIGAGGYGEPILTGIRLDDVSLILQGAIPAAAMALAMQGLFELLERVVVPRGLRL